MTKRVLIVDDRSTIRSIFTKILSERPDLEVCGEAEDGLEAIQKAKSLKPDLVLLDVSMPMMSGIEVASVLRKFFPSMAIILVTMHGEKIGRSLAAAVGVDAVLAKQDGMTGLVEAVNKALASRAPVAPIIEARLEPPAPEMQGEEPSTSASHGE
jgi:DNA-binding NarL/FixJ family response regulator